MPQKGTDGAASPSLMIRCAAGVVKPAQSGLAAASRRNSGSFFRVRCGSRSRLYNQFMRILGVIPARLGSTRLPRKVLLEIAGRPMVEWVWRAAVDSRQMDEVVVATDSEEVLEVCAQRGIPARMTPADCASGSDRVYAVAQQVQAEIYVNIQGDEPLLTPQHFAPMLQLFARDAVRVATVAVPCPPEDVANPNAVKVVMAGDGRALYFSRSTIPFDRDGTGGVAWRKHLGLYAYRRDALAAFAKMPPSPLELAERLEQLRMLENGMDIYVGQAVGDTIGVDTEADRLRVEHILNSRS